MNRKRMVLILALLFVTTTALGLDVRRESSGSESAPLPQATPPDLTEPIATDYDAAEPIDLAEREKRKRTNQRYDKEGWVQKNVHPETGMIGRHTEQEPPPTLPTEESDLIVTGRVVGVSTHLSNDKSGVYSEYRIKVEEIMKNRLSVDLAAGRLVTIDRAGGAVRYPHGQTVIYKHNDKDLPERGREYVLFLKNDKNSENYLVITIYELRATNTVPLDHGRDVDDIKRMGKSEFVNSIREKVSGPDTDESMKRKQ